jgi:hypothetical protein
MSGQTATIRQKPATVEDYNIALCFVIQPRNGKHLPDKLWCYDKNELPGNHQQATLDIQRKPMVALCLFHSQ